MTQELPPDIQAIADQYIESVGGLEGFKGMMEDFKAVCRRFSRDKASLMARYPRRWVAIDIDGLVLVGDSMEEVFAACKARGLAKGDVLVEYMNPDHVFL